MAGRLPASVLLSGGDFLFLWCVNVPLCMCAHKEDAQCDCVCVCVCLCAGMCVSLRVCRHARLHFISGLRAHLRMAGTQVLFRIKAE